MTKSFDTSNEVILEKINNICSRQEFVIKKIENIDIRQETLQLKVARMEAFSRGLAFLFILMIGLCCQVYKEDQEVSRTNDSKHDQLFQVMQERIIKIEQRVKIS